MNQTTTFKYTICIKVICALMFANIAFAQEVSIGVGTVTGQSIYKNLGYSLEDAPSKIIDNLLQQFGFRSGLAETKYASSPALLVKFRMYNVGDMPGLFGISASHQKYQYVKSFENGLHEAETGCLNFLMISWHNYHKRYKPYYKRNSTIKTYYGFSAGLGYEQNSQKVNYLWPGAHLTLYGIRYGQKLSVFAEFGIGMNGLVNCGISYNPKNYN